MFNSDALVALFVVQYLPTPTQKGVRNFMPVLYMLKLFFFTPFDILYKNARFGTGSMMLLSTCKMFVELRRPEIGRE